MASVLLRIGPRAMEALALAVAKIGWAEWSFGGTTSRVPVRDSCRVGENVKASSGPDGPNKDVDFPHGISEWYSQAKKAQARFSQHTIEPDECADQGGEESPKSSER